MTFNQKCVEEFHLKYGHYVGDVPHLPPFGEIERRERMITEEYFELKNALYLEPLDNIAKEAADLLYVLYGLAVQCGFDLDDVFRQVHENNMTKGLEKDENGKTVKGPDYKPLFLKL